MVDFDPGLGEELVLIATEIASDWRKSCMLEGLRGRLPCLTRCAILLQHTQKRYHQQGQAQ
jgi:hypothetical protein